MTTWNTRMRYFRSSWWWWCCWPGRWWSQTRRWRRWSASAQPRPRPSRTVTDQWPSWCPPGHQQSQWCQPHGVCHLGCDRESHRQFHFNSQHWGGLGGPLDPQCIDTLPHTPVGLVKFVLSDWGEKSRFTSNQDQSNLIGKRENLEMV